MGLLWRELPRQIGEADNFQSWEVIIPPPLCYGRNSCGQDWVLFILASPPPEHLINSHSNLVVLHCAQSCLTLVTPWTVARLLCQWDSPGKNTGVGYHFIFQGILPTQEPNRSLLHCRRIRYQLSYEGSLATWLMVSK